MAACVGTWRYGTCLCSSEAFSASFLLCSLADCLDFLRLERMDIVGEVACSYLSSNSSSLVRCGCGSNCSRKAARTG
ncbi:hypothetical protein HYQ46_000093 [Verticillium longisporum]|nr:hypothetical protein HYQ46_000093 [Verticillium longisporum]